MAQVRFLSVSHADENPCSPLGCLEGKMWVFRFVQCWWKWRVQPLHEAFGCFLCGTSAVWLWWLWRLRCGWGGRFAWDLLELSMQSRVFCFFPHYLILQVPIAELQCEWQLAARCVRTCSVGDERHMKRWGLRHVFSRMETLPYWLCVSAIHCTDTGLIDVYSSHILSIDSLLTQMCSCNYVPRMAQGISSKVQFYCK